MGSSSKLLIRKGLYRLRNGRIAVNKHAAATGVCLSLSAVRKGFTRSGGEEHGREASPLHFVGVEAQPWR